MADPFVGEGTNNHHQRGFWGTVLESDFQDMRPSKEEY